MAHTILCSLHLPACYPNPLPQSTRTGIEKIRQLGGFLRRMVTTISMSVRREMTTRALSSLFCSTSNLILKHMTNIWRKLALRMSMPSRLHMSRKRSRQEDGNARKLRCVKFRYGHLSLKSLLIGDA